jgi:flagellar hook-associated protein 1 FlgK
MSDLFGSLSIAVRSLLAQEGAINTTTNNIANVNTPGYSRQLPILTEAPPLDTGQLSIGNGVDFDGVQSVRDNILELRIDQETQQQNRLQSYLNAMNQVQSLFNETGGAGLSDALNQFFNSFQALADNPTDIPTRTAAISAGQDLASAFQQTGQQLNSIQQGVDQEVGQTVAEINSDSAQLASLNQQITSVQGNSEQAGMLQDQQYSVLNGLSKLVDVAVTYANDGSLTITTSNGVPLVAGGQSFALSTQTNPATGFQDIYSQGSDVTSTITGGQLAGLLEARDQAIPSVTSNLDNLAAGIINAVNAQSQQGYDLNGDPGGNFFQPVVQPSPGSNAGAAENMAVAITDPSQVAASSSLIGYGTTGLNLNPGTTFTAGDTLTISQDGHSHTTANTLTTVGALMSDINTWGQQYGISAYLAGGNLQIQGNPAGGTMTVIPGGSFTTDVGALTPGTQGDNGNALALANLQNQAVVNGATATDYYSDLVSTVGNDVSTATDEQEAVGLVLTQLQNQRSDISGVSLDEEAANLIQYQRAYEAAAEVVAAINNVTIDVLQTV